MTMYYGEEKPSLDSLAHYGKKGMKWGVRKERPTGHDIRSARARLGLEQDKLFGKQREVRKTGKGQKALDKMTTDFLKNPDRAIATRMTRGEKAVSIILAGPFAVIPIGASTAVSRTIAKKQATGAYNKR